MSTDGGSGTGRRWNPLRVVHRALRRFARRPRAMQLRTVGVIAAVLAGIVLYVTTAPAVTSASGNSALSGLGAAAASSVSSTPGVTPPDRASTSSRGVSAHSINVVFPISNLTSLSSEMGFAGDVEFTQQAQAIRLYVNQINRQGGIHGRKINAIIPTFDPTNEAEMRALCKTWTEGSPPVFAVVDGIGDWTGDDELCITQEGHTPFIGAWTTVSNWTTLGSPYLWWTGPDQASILSTLVAWGLSNGTIGYGHKLGVIVGDRASDQLALKQYLEPDLQRAGITPVVETIAADPSELATTSSEAPLVVQQLRSAGVTAVVPLMPFNAFFPVLQAQTQQNYFPRLLLSDYESSIQSALGLIPVPYEKALNDQEGITTLTLGGVDDNRPESQGGYDPGVRSCYDTWHKAYPKPPPGKQSFYIEEQGPIVAWCQGVRLFATAAEMAGPNLNRRTFVEAMSRIKNYPGTWSPSLSYGPDKFYGPSEYQVVEIHNNVPPSSACKLLSTGKPQGTCWVVKQTWRPLLPG